MEQHPNAKLTPKGGRETLVSRIESGLGVAEAARQMGISRQTAGKWLRRSRSGEGLSDRSSRPRRLARLTPPEVEERVCEARSSMLLAPLGLAATTGVPARTCARIVSRRGMPRLADVDRVTGEARRRGPVTPCATSGRGRASSCTSTSRKWPAYPTAAATAPWARLRPARGAGAACLHVAVDDFSRVAYAELLPDERKGTCAAFMSRCLRFFEGMGVRVERVMTDNGPGYRSGEFNALLESEGARHVSRAYSPWQNGKVERMNRTLAQEWQYARAWDGRRAGLPPCPPSSNTILGASAQRVGACRPCRIVGATYRHTTTSEGARVVPFVCPRRATDSFSRLRPNG